MHIRWSRFTFLIFFGLSLFNEGCFAMEVARENCDPNVKKVQPSTPQTLIRQLRKFETPTTGNKVFPETPRTLLAKKDPSNTEQRLIDLALEKDYMQIRRLLGREIKWLDLKPEDFYHNAENRGFVARIFGFVLANTMVCRWSTFCLPSDAGAKRLLLEAKSLAKTLPKFSNDKTYTDAIEKILRAMFLRGEHIVGAGVARKRVFPSFSGGHFWAKEAPYTKRIMKVIPLFSDEPVERPRSSSRFFDLTVTSIEKTFENENGVFFGNYKGYLQENYGRIYRSGKLSTCFPSDIQSKRFFQLLSDAAQNMEIMEPWQYGNYGMRRTMGLGTFQYNDFKIPVIFWLSKNIDQHITIETTYPVLMVLDLDGKGTGLYKLLNDQLKAGSIYNLRSKIIQMSRNDQIKYMKYRDKFAAIIGSGFAVLLSKDKEHLDQAIKRLKSLS